MSKIEFKSIKGDPMESRRVVRPKEVCTFLSISRSTLWRWIKAGHFPEPESLGPNTRGWRLATVINWEG